MEKGRITELIRPVFRSIIFWILGCLLFAAGFQSIITNHKKEQTDVLGGCIFISLGLFLFVLGIALIYSICKDDEFDTSTEKNKFLILTVGMTFLSISGLLTVLWGYFSIKRGASVVNMVMVMAVGLLLFVFPIGLFWYLVPQPAQSPSKISPIPITIEGTLEGYKHVD
ncbi:hypothetical protein ACHQM5_015628 [Ranunculus cassubicifolius]